MTIYIIYIVLVVISFLASLTVYRKKDSPVYLRVFPGFLLITFLVEMIAIRRASLRVNNLFLYSLFSAFEFTFYLYFFSAIYKNTNAKKVALVAMFTYMIAAFVNIFFIQGRNAFHTYTFMLGCALIIGFGAYYLFRLVNQPQTGKISRDPTFWITAGLMIYYCCDLPVFGILNYITSLSKGTYNGLVVVYNFMNIVLYSFFTVAFLCRLSIRKYTS